MTGGLVAARSVAAARGRLTAHCWVGGPRGRLYQLLKAASHYPLALLLPVSLPVAIECQPMRALEVGAVIAVAWLRQ